MVSANDRETLAERLRTVAASNARLFLEQRNVRRVVMEGLKPIASVEGSIAGPAHTIRFLPAREDIPAPPGQSLPFWLCDNIDAGEVLVCDALGCMDGAVFGDMMATRAKYRQAAGAVIDGVVRDVSGIAATGLPVFARGSYAHPFGGRLLPWETNAPVQCGGVLVRPGDWILADDTSVMVIPEDMVATVADEGDTKRAEEAFSQALLEAGVPLDEAYPLSESLRPHLKRFREAGTVPILEQTRRNTGSS